MRGKALVDLRAIAENERYLLESCAARN